MIIKTHTMMWPMTSSGLHKAPAFAALTLMLALLCQGEAYARAPRPERLMERCDVALTYVKFLLDRKRGELLVFSEGDARDAFKVSNENWSTPNGGATTSPPRKLVDAMNEISQHNAVSRCPAIKKLLGYRRVEIKPAIPHVNLEPSGDRARVRRTAVIVNLPVISQSGDAAIIISSEVSGPLDAAIYAIYLTRRAKSAWKVISIKVLSVA